MAIPNQINGESPRVTLWNNNTKRKIAGKAAPMQKNLADYLHRHPECELYNGQDALLTAEEKRELIEAQNRIAIWNTVTRKRISGNAAPREKKLAEYLRKHPECEVYNGQDKGGPAFVRPRTNPAAVSSAKPMPISSSIADQYGASLAPVVPIPYKEPAGADRAWPPSAHSLEDMQDMLLGMSLEEMDVFAQESMPTSGASMGMGVGGSMGIGGSFGFSGSLNQDLNQHLFGLDEIESSGFAGGSGPNPMSAAQRIKRDRAMSTAGSPRSLGQSFGMSGSLQAHQHQHQRMRQGPGPGSLPPVPLAVPGGAPGGGLSSTPDLMDAWAI